MSTTDELQNYLPAQLNQLQTPNIFMSSAWNGTSQLWSEVKMYIADVAYLNGLETGATIDTSLLPTIGAVNQIISDAISADNEKTADSITASIVTDIVAGTTSDEQCASLAEALNTLGFTVDDDVPYDSTINAIDSIKRVTTNGQDLFEIILTDAYSTANDAALSTLTSGNGDDYVYLNNPAYVTGTTLPSADLTSVTTSGNTYQVTMTGEQMNEFLTSLLDLVPVADLPLTLRQLYDESLTLLSDQLNNLNNTLSTTETTTHLDSPLIYTTGTMLDVTYSYNADTYRYTRANFDWSASMSISTRASSSGTDATLRFYLVPTDKMTSSSNGVFIFTLPQTWTIRDKKYIISQSYTRESTRTDAALVASCAYQFQDICKYNVFSFLSNNSSIQVKVEYVHSKVDAYTIVTQIIVTLAGNDTLSSINLTTDDHIEFAFPIQISEYAPAATETEDAIYIRVSTTGDAGNIESISLQSNATLFTNTTSPDSLNQPYTATVGTDYAVARTYAGDTPEEDDEDITKPMDDNGTALTKLYVWRHNPTYSNLDADDPQPEMYVDPYNSAVTVTDYNDSMVEDVNPYADSNYWINTQIDLSTLLTSSSANPINYSDVQPLLEAFQALLQYHMSPALTAIGTNVDGDMAEVEATEGRPFYAINGNASLNENIAINPDITSRKFVVIINDMTDVTADPIRMVAYHKALSGSTLSTTDYAEMRSTTHRYRTATDLSSTTTQYNAAETQVEFDAFDDMATRVNLRGFQADEYALVTAEAARTADYTDAELVRKTYADATVNQSNEDEIRLITIKTDAMDETDAYYVVHPHFYGTLRHVSATNCVRINFVALDFTNRPTRTQIDDPLTFFYIDLSASTYKVQGGGAIYIMPNEFGGDDDLYLLVDSLPTYGCNADATSITLTSFAAVTDSSSASQSGAALPYTSDRLIVFDDAYRKRTTIANGDSAWVFPIPVTTDMTLTSNAPAITQSDDLETSVYTVDQDLLDKIRYVLVSATETLTLI